MTAGVELYANGALELDDLELRAAAADMAQASRAPAHPRRARSQLAAVGDGPRPRPPGAAGRPGRRH
jgi:hypothetical protein